MRQLLAEVLRIDLHVTRFVHDLRGGVVLGVDPRHLLDDLRGADQRALLAVHELRQDPRLLGGAEVEPLVFGELLERRAGAVERHRRVERVVRVAGDLPRVDIDVPVDVGGDVPHRRLRLLVQLAQGIAAALVVPREQRVAGRAHVVDGLTLLCVGDGLGELLHRPRTDLLLVDRHGAPSFLQVLRRRFQSLADSFAVGTSADCAIASGPVSPANFNNSDIPASTPPTQDPDVGRGVVVAGDAVVEHAVVREDRDADAHGARRAARTGTPRASAGRTRRAAAADRGRSWSPC